ncbi:hypothetical protein TNCV_1906701 [Trichonephila clavipes]|uniref:Uncharacterized protein n=1 Tax=Trichonephila inaurata madagascariensis TaxID=2747483 RepID=A0A8X6XFE7_9ARAC|nr:hypothetical protein TNCV_1906701 [Trichonephila clavipes]GFY50771.1 hypothetical protein TNIN_242941 [Trichonephila inaurata madagascariensis]
MAGSPGTGRRALSSRWALSLVGAADVPHYQGGGGRGFCHGAPVSELLLPETSVEAECPGKEEPPNVRQPIKRALSVLTANDGTT